MLIETLVALFSLIVFASLDFQEAVFRGISFAGAAILIWIATSIWKVRSLDSGERISFGFWKITGMILANGVLWTYWITICIPKAMLVGEELFLGEYLFMGLVQLGWLISTTIAAYLFSRFRNLLSRPRVIPVVFKVFSLVFIYFALDMLVKSILYFVSG
jgi:threonine/homoserine/homoserine lactone efflux protein